MPDNKLRKGPFLADDRIVELYWSRNEDAIKHTDRKYGKWLLRVAYNILHDKLDSEECQNDTYMKVWNAIPPTRPDSFSLFILKIVRNIALNRYKSKIVKSRIQSSFTVSIDELKDTLSGKASPEKEVLSHEFSRLINAFLNELPERQHFIFISRFYLGETFEKISRELRVHISTVQRETEKIKDELKEYLERNGEDIG